MSRLLLIALLVFGAAYLYYMINRSYDKYENYQNKNIEMSDEEYEEFLKKKNSDDRRKVNIQSILKNSDHDHELINDDFIEKMPKKHVRFMENKNIESVKNRENNLGNNKDENIDDIFIMNPIEIGNTNLTLSENEYFNNI